MAAGDVLVATNGYTGQVVPWLQRRLVPIGSHIIATEPLSADHAASISLNPDVPSGCALAKSRARDCTYIHSVVS